MPLPPAQTFPVATLTTNSKLYLGPGCLMGWSFTETTGTATAEVDLYDGVGTGGKLYAQITLLASQSTRDYIPGNGLEIRTGVFLNVTSGSIEGSVWIVPTLYVANDEAIAFAQGGQPHYAHDV